MGSQYMAGGQGSHRDGEGSGPCHLHGYLVTGRDRVVYVEPLVAEQCPAPLRALQYVGQVASDAVGEQGVGKLLLHHVLVEVTGEFLAHGPLGDGFVVADRCVDMGVLWQTRHARKGS